MMRRNYTYPVFLTLLLAASLMGCRQEPLPGAGEPIRFSVRPVAVSSAPSKAEDLSGVTPPAPPVDGLTVNGSKIKIWGSFMENGGTSWTDIFDAEVFTLSSGSWNYASTPVRRWVEGADYRFTSAYPADNVSPTSAGSDQLTIGYDMTSENYDLMLASKTTSTTAQAGDAVALNFQHACAAVRFVFRKSANESDAYFINSFKLNNLSAGGSLSYNSGVATWTPNTPSSGDLYAWSTGAQAADRWPVTSDYTEFTAGQWYFVIPQTLPDTGNLPTVTFTYVAANDSPFPVTITLPTGTWDAGKIYVYYIAIQPGKSSVGVQITPWETYKVSVDDISFM